MSLYVLPEQILLHTKHAFVSLSHNAQDELIKSHLLVIEYGLAFTISLFIFFVITGTTAAVITLIAIKEIMSSTSE